MITFKYAKMVVHQRARFNKCDQLEGETAEEYITVLYGLVKTCKYKDFQDKMLQDSLIIEFVIKVYPKRCNCILEDTKKNFGNVKQLKNSIKCYVEIAVRARQSWKM